MGAQLSAQTWKREVPLFPDHSQPPATRPAALRARLQCLSLPCPFQDLFQRTLGPAERTLCDSKAGKPSVHTPAPAIGLAAYSPHPQTYPLRFHHPGRHPLRQYIQHSLLLDTVQPSLGIKTVGGVPDPSRLPSLMASHLQLQLPPNLVSLPPHCRSPVHSVAHQLPYPQMVPIYTSKFGHNFLSNSDRVEVGTPSLDQNEFVLKSGCRVYAVTGKNRWLCSPLVLLLAVELVAEIIVTVLFLREPGGSFDPVHSHRLTCIQIKHCRRKSYIYSGCVLANAGNQAHSYSSILHLLSVRFSRTTSIFRAHVLPPHVVAL